MKSLFLAVRTLPVDIDVVLLLVRLVCGYAFILIGWGKIQTPMSWMGENPLFPGVFQALAAVAEFGGGVTWMLGFLTRPGALGIGCTMIVAVYVHRFVAGDPFINFTGGASYQLAAVYFLIALVLMVAGPGRYSLDRVLFGVRNEHH